MWRRGEEDKKRKSGGGKRNTERKREKMDEKEKRQRKAGTERGKGRACVLHHSYFDRWKQCYL